MTQLGKPVPPGGDKENSTEKKVTLSSDATLVSGTTSNIALRTKPKEWW